MIDTFQYVGQIRQYDAKMRGKFVNITVVARAKNWNENFMFWFCQTYLNYSNSSEIFVGTYDRKNINTLAYQATGKAELN